MIVEKRLLSLVAAFAATAALAQSRPPGWVPPLPSPPTDRVVVCVDVSRSMGAPAVEHIRDGLRRVLVPENSGGDLRFEVSVFAFAGRVTNVIPFTRRLESVRRGLGLLVVDGEQTGKSVLYDCVAKAAEYLRVVGAGGQRILVVSDGHDEGSQSTAITVVRTLAASPAIAVEAIGYGPAARAFAGALSALTGSSGGRFLSQPDDFAPAFATLLNSTVKSGGAAVAPVAPPVISAPSVPSGPSLHTSKVAMRATTEAKCLQLIYGVAVDILQDVSATSAVVSGRLGPVSITISCVAPGTGQNAIALVTAAGATAGAAANAADTIAPKLAAAN